MNYAGGSPTDLSHVVVVLGQMWQTTEWSQPLNFRILINFTLKPINRAGKLGQTANSCFFLAYIQIQSLKSCT